MPYKRAGSISNSKWQALSRDLPWPGSHTSGSNARAPGSTAAPPCHQASWAHRALRALHGWASAGSFGDTRHVDLALVPLPCSGAAARRRECLRHWHPQLAAASLGHSVQCKAGSMRFKLQAGTLLVTARHQQHSILVTSALDQQRKCQHLATHVTLLLKPAHCKYCDSPSNTRK